MDDRERALGFTLLELVMVVAIIGILTSIGAVRYADAVSSMDDAAGWMYVNDASASDFGRIWVNCTHTDAVRTLWSAY